jgi:signal transduction histidine kinase
MQTHDHVESGATFLPHGFCYLWNPHLLWTHVASDFLIGAAYVTIAFSLAWLVHRVRRDIPFSWAFVAFGLFIITCGMTHFMEIWTLWKPVYWLSGGVKVVTAVVSVATAIAMPFTVPKAVATVRDARLSRERAMAEVRAATLEEQNARLVEQAVELEKQRAEARSLADELARTNAALEAALAETSRAHAEAEGASEAKSVFLRTMSHELRTPLNAVIGYAQLLEIDEEHPLEPRQRDYATRIGRSATHLRNLIDEVLTLASDLREGRAPNISAVRLQEVIGEVEMMTATQAAKKGIALEVGKIPDAIIRTDVLWLRQILLNLAANALKFTTEGRIAITAEIVSSDLRIQVTDSGIGIPAEHLDLVFQPFWQGDQRMVRPYEGSGLGLSVSRGIAERLGGTITVASQVGEGSTFTVMLPVSLEETED